MIKREQNALDNMKALNKKRMDQPQAGWKNHVWKNKNENSDGVQQTIAGYATGPNGSQTPQNSFTPSDNSTRGPMGAGGQQQQSQTQQQAPMANGIASNGFSQGMAGKYGEFGSYVKSDPNKVFDADAYNANLMTKRNMSNMINQSKQNDLVAKADADRAAQISMNDANNLTRKGIADNKLNASKEEDSAYKDVMASGFYERLNKITGSKEFVPRVQDPFAPLSVEDQNLAMIKGDGGTNTYVDEYGLTKNKDGAYYANQHKKRYDTDTDVIEAENIQGKKDFYNIDSAKKQKTNTLSPAEYNSKLAKFKTNLPPNTTKAAAKLMFEAIESQGEKYTSRFQDTRNNFTNQIKQNDKSHSDNKKAALDYAKVEASYVKSMKTKGSTSKQIEQYKKDFKIVYNKQMGIGE